MTEHAERHPEFTLNHDEGMDAYQASRCRALLAAVMLQALKDLAPSRYKGIGVEDMRDAEAWFESDDLGAMSFRWICSHLDLDPAVIRMGYRVNRAEFQKVAVDAIHYVAPRIERHDAKITMPAIPAWRVQADAERLESSMRRLLGEAA